MCELFIRASPEFNVCFLSAMLSLKSDFLIVTPYFCMLRYKALGKVTLLVLSLSLFQVLLRQQMGEEKYKAYAVMVRQLKFFEDVAFKC